MSRIHAWRGFDGTCRPNRNSGGIVHTVQRVWNQDGSLTVIPVTELVWRDRFAFDNNGIIAGGDVVCQPSVSPLDNWFDDLDCWVGRYEWKSWKATTKARDQFGRHPHRLPTRGVWNTEEFDQIAAK